MTEKRLASGDAEENNYYSRVITFISKLKKYLSMITGFLMRGEKKYSETYYLMQMIDNI